MNILPIFSTIITFIFAIAVFARWRHKKPAHLFFWGLGLLFYGLGTLMEALLLFSYHILALKIWYLTGAMLTAAWLGQGTVYLLVRRRGVAHALMAVLALASLAGLILLFLAPVAPGAPVYDITRPASEQYKDILVRDGATIMLTILLNLYGTLTLVGGALLSAFLFWRKKVLLHRMLGNVLIAAGALSPALGGSLLKAGLADLLYLSEFIGVAMMYAGFILATSPQAEAVAESSPSPAG